MRIGWVLAGLLACGGADAPPPVKPVAPVGDPALAFGAEVSLPSSSEGVAPTATFGLHVRVVGTTVEYGTDGTVRGTLEADDDEARQDAFSAGMRAATTPGCPGGRTTVVGTREAPQTGDTIVFTESTFTSDIPSGFLFTSQHAAVLAVRQLGGRDVAVLPFRFCGTDAENPKPTSTIDIAPQANSKLTIIPASGAGARITELPWTTSAAELARTLRAVASNRPIARVRVTGLVRSDLSAQHLVDILSAAVRADAQSVELQFTPHAGYQLDVGLGGVSAAKNVDPARVRQALVNTGDALLTCYERAAFTLPTLDGTVPVQATVTAGGKVTATVPDDVGDEMATCMRGVFESLQIEGVRKAGSFTATIDLKRTPR